MTAQSNYCDVCIIIPAYNEMTTIGNVVEQVRQYGTPIVIDDGSTDDTAKFAKIKYAVVVRHPGNRGYDASLNTGFRKAANMGFKYAITFDADGQHKPAEIAKFIGLFSEGMELVLGIRPNNQRLSEWLFSIYTRYHYGIQDPLCGMKGYAMEIYHRLGYFDSYGSIGTELALFARKKNYKWNQIDIITTNRKDKPRFHNRYRANILILKALFNSIVRERPFKKIRKTG